MNTEATDKDAIKRYFDDDSSRYESMRYTSEYKDCHQFSYLARRAKVLELLPPTGNAILDVGCGPGVYTQDLLDRGYRVSACDISPKMVERAGSRFQNEIASGRVVFHVGEIHDLDVELRSFDAAICIGLISYVSNLERFLGRLASLLKPGGIAVIQISKKYSPKWFHDQVVYPLLQRAKRLAGRGNKPVNLGFTLHRYGVSCFNSMCASSGLVLEEGVHFDYTLPLLGTVGKSLNLRFAEFMETCRRGVFPRILAADYIGRYRKIDEQ